MHRVSLLQRIFIGSLLCIGSFHGTLNAEVEEPDIKTLQRDHVVFVEPKEDVVISPETGERVPVPYLQRRGEWGVMIGANYSSYEPLNYQPNFTLGNYRQNYTAPSLPLVEGQFVVRRNYQPISIGGELSGGGFQNSHGAIAGTVLSLTELRVGVVASYDTLYKDPYVVPYLSGGAYMMMFKETLGGNVFSGNTQPAPYINAGCAFTLDWIDSKAAHEGYEESGLQSTYLYVEGRHYFASANKKDPNFGNTFNFTAGVRLEF